MTNPCTVGDYSMFVKDWTEPSGGIHGYLKRFLASGDATFQHIAIWTLLQLLESEDLRLKSLIDNSTEIVTMIHNIAEKNIDSDDESEDGEGEVVQLARRSVSLLSRTDSSQPDKDADRKDVVIRDKSGRE